tara:strand:- start:63 stop:560 length:498 start_codon:yes stop_codon:yes gene_type:complete
MEFSELLDKLDNFNNSHQYIDKIKENKLPEFDKKDYRGNQYEMDQFNWQIQYAEYKKKVNDSKKGIVQKEYEEMESIDDIQTKLNNEQFSKPWGRMSEYCKKVKLQEYIINLVNEGKIPDQKQDAYVKYLYKKLSQKQLKTKKDIEYNSETQVIVSIQCVDSKLN